MSERIEIIDLELENAECAVMAWGVHDPGDFIAQSGGRLEPEDADRVKHLRMQKVEDVPDGFNWWCEPVEGEPNATIVYP